MLSGLIITVFITGYLAIMLEQPLKIDKAASALITGVLCWTIFIFSQSDRLIVNEELMLHLGDISSILFFLLGAMVIVELIDSHYGFSIISNLIRTGNKGSLLVIISFITFFLSAVIDNLTTTIVMLSLTGKLLTVREDRLNFAGIIIIAANAGGAWSPLGDVTTTMLWIGGQITAHRIIAMLILPSLLCAAVPMLVLWLGYRKQSYVRTNESVRKIVNKREQYIIFFSGIALIFSVPVFKTVTNLPPFIGMMLALGILWIIVSVMHKSKDIITKRRLSAAAALNNIDTPSILFFLGILLAVGALEAGGMLKQAAVWLMETLRSEAAVGVCLGLLSAIIDNVPLMAAAQGMYDLESYPADHSFWFLLALTTGTGGSAIIIGSAAGVVAMGIEKINFFWFLKRMSWLALLGFFAGVGTYLLFFY